MKNFYLTYIKPFLKFMRVIDENSELSITNILVFIFAFKFAYAPMEAASVQDMALALSAMGVYVAKKAVNTYSETKKNSGVPSEVIDKLKDFAGMEEE